MKTKGQGFSQMKMNEGDVPPSCERADDLVTYLYGEASEREATDFEAHARGCASCRTELAQFRQVRTSIWQWRQESLGALSSEQAVNSRVVSPIAGATRLSPERKRSALAALREFFALSPVWLRASVAAAGLVFCALLALVVANYMKQPAVVTVERVVREMPSEEELARMLADRRREQALTTTPASSDEPKKQTATIVGDSATAKLARPERSTKLHREVRQAVARRRENPTDGEQRPGISPQESRELARDLRLTVASNEDDDLPRLSDLLDETN